MVQGDVYTYFFSRALAAPLFSGAKPFEAILVEGIMRNNSVEEQFCEINFEFGPLVQEMSFKRFLIKSWRGPHVQQSGTIYVILSISFLSRVYDMAGCFETQTVVMSFYVLKKINKMQAAG